MNITDPFFHSRTLLMCTYDLPLYKLDASCMISCRRFLVENTAQADMRYKYLFRLKFDFHTHLVGMECIDLLFHLEYL